MKYILALMLLFTPLVAMAQGKTKQHKNPEPVAEQVVDGVREIYETGLYRVIDPKTGYIIYIYRDTNQNVDPQIAIVPLDKSKAYPVSQ